MPDVERTRASLVEVLDRTLSTGVAIRGDVVLAIAGIDLVTIDLRAVIASSSLLTPHSQSHASAAVVHTERHDRHDSDDA